MGSLPVRGRPVNGRPRLPHDADALLVAAHAAIRAMTPAELAALILCQTNGEARTRPALRLAAVRLAGLAQGSEVAR